MNAVLTATLTDLVVPALAEHCQTQVKRFRARQAHDDRFAMELFRRSIVERDELAWEWNYRIYHDQMNAWCRRSGAAEEDLDEIVNAAWVKFWTHFTAEKFRAAAALSDVLAYLKMCARSVTLDAERRRASTVSLDAVDQSVAAEPSSDEHCIDAEQREQLWRFVERHLRNERERTLAMLTYQFGLRPAEVHTIRPDLFPHVSDVYRLIRSLLDRIRRDPDVRAWRRGG